MPLLVPLWVASTQPEGIAGSAFFRGDKLVSYGTVIAQRAKLKDGRTVYLLNDSHYSDSTSRLQNLARAAFHDAGVQTVEVPSVGRWGSEEFFSHTRILKELHALMVELETEAAKSRQPKRARLETEATAITARADAYQKLFNVNGNGKPRRKPCAE
jgi:hypothetical protein